MCGRYRRRSDKQRIVEAFEVGASLDELYLEPEDDVAPGSMQPVVYVTPKGERDIDRMRWGFNTPDRPLFNARAEGVNIANLWKDAFSHRRCIVPADSFYKWQKVKSSKKPKFEFTIPGREPFGMAGLLSTYCDCLWTANWNCGASTPARAALILRQGSSAINKTNHRTSEAISALCLSRNQQLISHRFV